MRLCYLIGGIPLVYGIVLFFLMKETPHWYANAGRFDDAVKVLADIERVSLGTETGRATSYRDVLRVPRKTTPSVLFSNKYIIGTCAIWSLYFVGQFCVYGMNAWLPAWFSGIGYSPSEAVALQTWNNFAAIISNSAAGFISGRVGRKRNLLGHGFCAAVIVICSIFVAPNQFLFCIGPCCSSVSP